MVESLDALDPSLVLSDAATELELPSVTDEASVVASLLPPSVDAELSVESELELVDDSEAPVESLESVDSDDCSSVEPADSVVPLPSISPDPSYVDAANNIQLEF